MKTYTQVLSEQQDQYLTSRANSVASHCPVFNVFYDDDDGVRKALYWTTRDELAITEAEARDIIETFHKSNLGITQ